MSAASPAPLPRPEAYPVPLSEAHPAGTPDAGDVTPTARPRPALSVAGGAVTRSAERRPESSGPHGDPSLEPGGTVAAGVRADRPRALDRTGDVPRVRLVPRSEPVAVPLRADSPAHERPPVLGSPEALARRRVPARGVDTWGDAVPVGEPLPDPTRLCCAVVQAAVEGLRGVRPLAQLTRWVTPDVYDRLALRARLVQEAVVAPSSARAGIRRVRVLRIGELAAEATVVVDDGPRVRAVALRVEEHRGRWRATALEIG